MSGTVLRDAFRHQAWATLTLLDACAALTPEQLTEPVPGTYGPILDGLRHIVDGEASYLNALTGGAFPQPQTDSMDLADLRRAVETAMAAWLTYLKTDIDPAAMVEEVSDDGYRRAAPAGIRLAQALHHGSDHRSQICTALTGLGIEPPLIDVWDFGAADGRITETQPTR